MIKVENLCKSFRTEDVETIALNNPQIRNYAPNMIQKRK